MTTVPHTTGSGAGRIGRRRRLRAFPYYLASLGTLVREVRNWPMLFRDLAGLPVRRPYPVQLREGTTFQVRCFMDAWMVKEVYVDRQYERHGTPIQPGWTVVDVGAHVGGFTVLAARRAPDVRVLAFEPTPSTHALLRRNVRLNGGHNVTTRRLAVAGTSGQRTLQTIAGHPERNRLVPRGDAPAGRAIEVEALALAEVFARFAIDRCDLLKLDCEGGEFDILLGAPPQLFRRVRHICLEYHNGATGFGDRDLLRLFDGLGLRARRTPSPWRAGEGFIHACQAGERS